MLFIKQWLSQRRKIGIQVDTETIKMVQIKRKGKALALQKWAQVPLLPDTLKNGLVVEVEQLATALRELFALAGLKNPGIIGAIPARQVVLRHLKLPLMPRKELEKAVYFQALSFLPFSPEETVVDFIPLYPETGLNFFPEETQEVLVVATRRLAVKGWVKGIKQAGGTPLVLEIEPLAINRVLLSRHEGEASRNFLWADLTPQQAQICLFRAGVPCYNRVLTPLKEGMPLLSAPPMPFSQQVALEIWKLVEYAQMEHPGDGIEQLYLTGKEAAMLKAALLNRHPNFSVQQLDPLARLKIPPVPPAELKELRSGYAIAIGLGLRGVE